MTGPRRVRIDDEPIATSFGPDWGDERAADGELAVTSFSPTDEFPASSEDDWRTAEEIMGERDPIWGRGDEDDHDDEDDEGRTHDLAPSQPDPFKESVTRSPTGRSVPIGGDPEYEPKSEYGDFLYAGNDDGERPNEVYTAGAFEEDKPTQRTIAEQNAWLREHDPRLTGAGIEREVSEALSRGGLTLAVVRAKAFPPHRPTAETIKLRDDVRRALTAMYEDGRRRDFMAEALGVSRQKLHALMTK